jgi:hypothetical protein
MTYTKTNLLLTLEIVKKLLGAMMNEFWLGYLIFFGHDMGS